MFTQTIIVISAVLSIWLSQEERLSWRRWSCIVGLLGQPFCIMATYEAKQWGMFAVNVIFAMVWIKAIHTYWIKPKRQTCLKP